MSWRCRLAGQSSEEPSCLPAGGEGSGESWCRRLRGQRRDSELPVFALPADKAGARSWELGPGWERLVKVDSLGCCSPALPEQIPPELQWWSLHQHHPSKGQGPSSQSPWQCHKHPHCHPPGRGYPAGRSIQKCPGFPVKHPKAQTQRDKGRAAESRNPAWSPHTSWQTWQVPKYPNSASPHLKENNCNHHY